MATKDVKSAIKLLLVATESSPNDGMLTALQAHDGIAVQHAQSLPEALAALESHEVDMLLVQPPLPPAEAQTLLRAIHQHCPGCLLIIIGSEEFYIEALQWLPAHAIHLIPVSAENTGCLPERVEEIIAMARFGQTKAQSLRERLLQMVVELTPVLLTEFDLDALLQRIVEEAVRLIPHAEGGSLLLWEDGDFAFRGFVGYDARLKTVRLPCNLPVIAALRRGESVHLHRISQQDSVVFPPQVREALQKYGRAEEIEETLAVPLLFSGQLLGYLTVDSFNPGQTFNPVEEEGLRHFAALATIALHNTRLLLAEKQARALAETIQQVGATLTATLDLEAVLDRLLEALFDLTPCEAADIMLAKADGATITRQRGYEYFGSIKDAQGFHFPLRKTANLQAAARQQAPLIIADTRTYDGWVTIPGTEWMRSHIAAPIFLDRELVGFLCAISAQAGKFSPEDGAVLAALAPLAAIALHNAQLFQGERKARGLAESLQKISARLTQTLDETEVTQIVVEQIPHLIPLDTLVISRIKENHQVISLYSLGLPPEEEQRLRAGVPLDTCPLWQEMLQTNTGLLIPDTAENPGWTRKEAGLHSSALLVPLQSWGSTLGFLTLTREQTDFYTPEHLETLQSLANLLVVALTNARRYKESLNRIADLEALRQMGMRTNMLQDPDAIIEVAVTQALTLTKASGVTFFRYDPRKESLLPVKSVGVSAAIQEYAIRPGDGACGKAWQKQKTIAVRDYAAWPEQSRHSGATSIRALIAIPVSWQAEHNGVLMVFHQDPERFFTPADISILQLLVQQGSAALYRANLFQALRRDHDRLVALADIDRQIIAAFDTSEETLRAILHHSINLLGLSKGMLALAHAGAEPDFIFYSEGLQNPDVVKKQVRENWDKERAVHVQNGPEGYVAVESFSSTSHAPPGLAQTEQAAAIITVPLWIRGRVTGILSLLADEPRVWEKEEIHLLHTLVGQAAIMLEKTQLTQDLQQRLVDTETLNRILRTTNSTLDLEYLLRYICREIRQLLRLPLAAVCLYHEGKLLTINEDVADGYPGIRQDFALVQASPILPQVLEKQTTLVFTDLHQDLPEIAPTLHRQMTRGLLTVPLVSRGKSIGILFIESPVPRTFQPQEIALVESIAAAISPALENARLHQETQRAFEELQRLDAMKSQFVQNVTHELRTPLSIVKGYVDLALDEDFGFNIAPELSQSLTAIQLYTNRLVELVESITALENVETGQMLLQPQPILPVLLRSVQAVRQKALRREIDILADLPAMLPQVNLDPQQLGLVLWHLLDNATKFSEPGGKIWLRAWVEDNEIRCQVQDEGIGISPDERERIFQRFYQVDGSIRRKYPGMGLGLSLVKEIVEKHGGRVWLTSDGPNRGATFTLALPIYHPEQEGVV